MTPRPKRRTRRFLQFSLRALLVFVLLVSIAMSWLAVRMQKARRQKEAVEAIKELGGDVWYDYQYEFFERQIGKGRRAGQLVEPWPDWVYRCVGFDFLHLIVLIDLGRYPPHIPKAQMNPPIVDSDLDVLAAFPELRTVYLSFQPITDAGLRNVAACSELRRICLHGTHVTDDGLQSLAGLSKLEELDVGDTKVTLQGVVASHKKLPSLSGVSISKTQLDSAGAWDGADTALPGITVTTILPPIDPGSL